MQRIKKYFHTLYYYSWARQLYLLLLFRLKITSLKKRRWVLLLAEGRSGSTLIIDLLIQSKELKVKGEIFSRKIWFPEAFLAMELAKTKKHKIFVFKLLPFHFSSENGEKLEKFVLLAHKSDAKILFNYRENKLEQALSDAVAKGRKSFNSYQHKTYYKVEILPTYLKAKLAQKILFYEWCKTALLNIPHFTVEYNKDLIFSQQKFIDDLCAYLAIKEFKPKIRTKKMLPSYTQAIENWEELYVYIETSPEFATYLPIKN